MNPQHALAQLAAVPDSRFLELFSHESLSLEIYKPEKVDLQTPHDRDEVYVVVAGNGQFYCGGEVTEFGPGDFLFVPAFVPHYFFDFSDDFSTWVLFYGPRGGEAGAKVDITDWQPAFQPDFFRLNKEWIELQCPLEPLDIAVLSDPETHIILPGGRIFAALEYGQVVGVVALRPFGEQAYEMTKMAVDTTCRGKGIGKKLIQVALYEARKSGATKVVLFSNSIYNAPAVQLYRNLGFVEVPLEAGIYKRANIKMEIKL